MLAMANDFVSIDCNSTPAMRADFRVGGSNSIARTFAPDKA